MVFFLRAQLVVTALGGFLIGMGSSFLLGRLARDREMKKVYVRLAELPQMQRTFMTFTVTIEGTEITATYEDGSVLKYIRDAFSATEHAPDGTVLWLTPLQFFWIPRNAFQTDDEWHAFRQWTPNAVPNQNLG